MADDEEYAAALNKLFKGSLELRETNYVCGFCGRKYDADLAPTYCDSDDCPAYEARRLWSQYNVSKQCEPLPAEAPARWEMEKGRYQRKD